MKYIAIIAGVALVAYIIYSLRGCDNLSKRFNRGNDTVIITNTKVELKVDTFKYGYPVYIPKPGKTVYVNIPVDVDTAAILKDYFAKKHYPDSLNNADLTVWLSDSITQNSIASRAWKWRINRPEKTITNTVEKTITQYDNGCHYYIGGSFQTNKFGIGPSINVTQGHINAGISYDLINKSGIFSLTYKIK